MFNQESIEIEQLYLNDLDENNFRSEVSMWRAVIIQALGDLKLPPSNTRYRRWRRQATKWFKDADKNFSIVCECADLSAEKVLTIAYDIISSRRDIG